MSLPWSLHAGAAREPRFIVAVIINENEKIKSFLVPTCLNLQGLE